MAVSVLLWQCVIGVLGVETVCLLFLFSVVVSVHVDAFSVLPVSVPNQVSVLDFFTVRPVVCEDCIQCLASVSTFKMCDFCIVCSVSVAFRLFSFRSH